MRKRESISLQVNLKGIPSQATEWQKVDLSKAQIYKNMIHQPTIDIILSVIDNYGDIGFACELMAAWRREVGTETIFVIWTDHIPEVTSFVDKNRHLLGEVEIHDYSLFWALRRTSVVWDLFHAKIPERQYFSEGTLILRIDYLSFDSSWTVHHLDEHIASTGSRQIIEVIPSPLSGGWGLIPAYDTGISRYDLATTYWLDEGKEWIVVFAYPSTMEVLYFDTIDKGSQVLVFGSEKIFEQENIIKMPWVDIATWHALVDESAWTLVRGEVSAVASIVRDKLAFWDMYKMIGGFHSEQSEAYLTMIHTNDIYRDIHKRLNGQKTWGIMWSELEKYIKKYSIPTIPASERTKNLITEIKKCIDSHEFSI